MDTTSSSTPLALGQEEEHFLKTRLTKHKDLQLPFFFTVHETLVELVFIMVIFPLYLSI
jgi:hypothetical protein